MTTFFNVMGEYANLISTFLMSEPIIYITGAIITIFVIRIIKRLTSI